MRSDTGLRSALALLVALVAAYPAVPEGVARAACYDVLGAASVALALMGLLHRRPERLHAWLLLLSGFLGWVIGDVVWSLEQEVWHLATYPVPSDAVYLVSYVFVAAGILRLVPRGRHGEDGSVALDALIVGTGFAVVTGVFVMGPSLVDTSLSPLGLVVTVAYPLADVVLLAGLVRLWLLPGVRSGALGLLGASAAVTLVADLVWQGVVIHTGTSDSSTWADLMWLLGYVLMTAACCSPSVTRPLHASPPAPGAATRLQLGALAVALALPGVALIAAGVSGLPLEWQVVGVGSVVLSLLTLLRVAGVLRVVQVQAVQLAALARSDPLTGAPNRRTWDHELSRACQLVRDGGDPLCVALLDLDHFKSYNDTHGHQAGDRLLREAVAAWTELLGGQDLLARYGGEEFAVLLPGRTPGEAAARIELLRTATPDGQTFSAGIAAWDPAQDPATVVAAADQALYRAKRAGRDRIHLVGGDPGGGASRGLVAALQPIVDLGTGEILGMEALARFEGEPTQLAFERAHRSGTGAELEAAAIQAAFAVRPQGCFLSVNLSLSLLGDARIAHVLPDDLTGVVLEITEDRDATAGLLLEPVLADLRRRGAQIAVDDWGTGFSNLDRVLRLRAEIVKLDLSLVRGLDSQYHRAAIGFVVRWADEVGAKVCAEGIETEEQRATLLALGVHCGQGYLFGRPAPPGTYDDLVGVSPRTPARPRGEPAA